MKTSKYKDFIHLSKAKMDDLLEGILYKDSSNSWYIFHNSTSFKGGWPAGFEALKKEYDVTSSWYLGNEDADTSTSHVIEVQESKKSVKDIIELRAEKRVERRAEQAEEDKFLSLDYSTLEEGAEVLFALKDYKTVRKLPTRGKLYKNPDSGTWFILHNDDNKSGGLPPTPISDIFGGEFSRSWNIGNSLDPYRKLIRFEILSRPKEKIADVPKDRFAVGCTITCLTPDQFEDKLKMKRFSHSGAFELYAGKKATVERNTSEREVAVKWFDGIVYNMSKNEFQEFYPEYLGRVVTIEDPAPTPEPERKEEPKVRLPLFPNGMVLTCLTEEQFKSKLGRTKFYHGGEFERLAGTKCTVIRQSSESYIDVRWNDYSTHSYKMNVNEFKEYYPELKETTVTVGGIIDSSKISIPEDSGSVWKIKSVTMGKFATPDHVVTLGSIGIPTDHIDAFSHCMHFEDKFKPDASYKYTPPVHPSSSKLRATSDSDIKGDSVPRKKNIDTLLILGL